MNVDHLIKRLDLQRLPSEGGYYKETYRSVEKLGERNLSTAIYYVLTGEENSRLHRLKSDEIYHFYFGDPVQMLLLHPNGGSEIVFLGENILAGQRPQVIVTKETWVGSMIVEGDHGFALMGATVSPGFDYEDLEMGNREELIEKYPQHKGLIQDLT